MRIIEIIPFQEGGGISVWVLWKVLVTVEWHKKLSIDVAWSLD